MAEIKTRRERMTEATHQEIRDTAFAVMREYGTNGLSVREITRRMGMSASAFYHYYPSLNDLITVLIVDSFKAMAAAVARARDEARAAKQPPVEQLLTMAHGIRHWGLEHAVRFQLIYGTPLAGYAAPAEVTVPYVRQISVPVLETLAEGIRSGALVPIPTLQHIPPSVRAHYVSQLGREDEVLVLAYHLVNVFWASIFGLVMLEVNNHQQPTVGDTSAFFDHHVRLQLMMIASTMRVG